MSAEEATNAAGLDEIGFLSPEEKIQLDLLAKLGDMASVVSGLFLKQVQGDRERAERQRKRKLEKQTSNAKKIKENDVIRRSVRSQDTTVHALHIDSKEDPVTNGNELNGNNKRKEAPEPVSVVGKKVVVQDLEGNIKAEPVEHQETAAPQDTLEDTTLDSKPNTDLDPNTEANTKLEADKESNPKEDEESDNEYVEDDEDDENDVIVLKKQPKYITGAKMKDYQLAGTQWLIRLAFNEFSGILADEMGLGKTIQTIALIAWLREQKEYKPILIVCPASVLDNWIAEFHKFAPKIPTLRYYGEKGERKKLLGDMSKAHYKPSRYTPVVITTYQMLANDKSALAKITWDWLIIDEGHRLKNIECKLMKDLKEYKSKQRLILTGTPLQNDVMELYSLLSFLNPHIFKNKDVFKNLFKFESTTETNANTPRTSGVATPVGNGVIPEQNEAKSKYIADQLAGILHPFMLRRMKDDVEIQLPPKKEYVLAAPHTPLQLELTEQIMNNNLRNFLIEQQTGEAQPDLPQNGPRKIVVKGRRGRPRKADMPPPPPLPEDSHLPMAIRKPTRGAANRARKSFVEGTEEEFLESLENGSQVATPTATPTTEDLEAIGKAHALQKATSKFNGAKLQNACAQLRKVANHPFVFDWPTDPVSMKHVVDDRLLEASGKMLLLERLLKGLFEKGHRVLIFSQFTTMLDIIQDWAQQSRGWEICRIDGSTNVDDRRTMMSYFNRESGPNNCNIFLLTTRAGGVGINLTGADTVIFFDSDWNPQQDLQAMARAHRIGQTKPVLIFRLVTANSIERKILERARNKRKLEALVIGKGKFAGTYGDINSFGKRGKRKDDTLVKFVAELANSEEEIKLVTAGSELLSDKQLEMLLDRSDATMKSKDAWAGEGTTLEVMETENDVVEENDDRAIIFGDKDVLEDDR